MDPAALDSYWWTIPVLLLSAVRSGLQEEVIVVGYLYARLRDDLGWGRWQVTLSTAVLRGSYHLYQGFGAFIGNAVMGVVFGWIYTKWGRLLPPRHHARAPRRDGLRRLPVRRAGVPRTVLLARAGEAAAARPPARPAGRPGSGPALGSRSGVRSVLHSAAVASPVKCYVLHVSKSDVGGRWGSSSTTPRPCGCSRARPRSRWHSERVAPLDVLTPRTPCTTSTAPTHDSTSRRTRSSRRTGSAWSGRSTTSPGSSTSSGARHTTNSVDSTTWQRGTSVNGSATRCSSASGPRCDPRWTGATRWSTRSRRRRRSARRHSRHGSTRALVSGRAAVAPADAAARTRTAYAGSLRAPARRTRPPPRNSPVCGTPG
ncbi:CPBP family intramembrane glutamic endopeptidase [Curtobacterium sp. MCJR17_043]|uniref:CPBP family intramembrane glutamic endopeptidase n=1 Tax=Curtobacterium sp. MCJR17_043 TaxID=2175660 RepID=UPI0032E915B0